ncbi:metal dependent phosphohydrolase [Thermosinus carboxydivorans Nor1]|uniref:Metal dependent phosphohydrolase n=1 Tax=Thermosinus carboxydivorans Nor1 TaxID=401526 RepID=A1HP93_9FIRM|nr:HD domain-containing protein [Thermosinus carboxydivorans]EAX48199.1 metal dependent phosphohydrolase [Thermosinus carboxydivorans Nor1]
MASFAGAVIAKMVLYFDGDVKRINHALKVYGLAKSIGEAEGLSKEEQDVLEIAAILHDIGIKESERKYNSSAGTYQEIEGPPIARKLLQEFAFSVQQIDRICYLIGHHHTYSQIDGVDFQILVEADFLVNIFEDGIDSSAIEKIKEKYFKTATGRAYLESMFKNKSDATN